MVEQRAGAGVDRFSLRPHIVKVIPVLSIPLGGAAAFVIELVLEVTRSGGVSPWTWTTAVLAGIIGLFIGPLSATGGIIAYLASLKFRRHPYWIRFGLVVLGSTFFAVLPIALFGYWEALLLVMMASVVFSAAAYVLAVAVSNRPIVGPR
ncbi:hypothetical protein KPL76_02945 [Subtercola sp. PAMC28395]|uniref:hypothetical protein n=1 Tax=Subtercola sp. PAMC28395 TaxID=2846775 RepID=UPI001C0C7E6B|nr:hypothetical protein [Subtercola sp. PAMC28395]QWT24379.1 hypothetical protein KPL76_02945 [Subtercola sp. PAMC28395]